MLGIYVKLGICLSSVITIFIFKGLSSGFRFPSWQSQPDFRELPKPTRLGYSSPPAPPCTEPLKLVYCDQEKFPLELQKIWVLRQTGQIKQRDKLHLKPTDTRVVADIELQDADVCQNTLQPLLILGPKEWGGRRQ